MKVKNQYLKILEYLHLSFNKWPSIQYKFWVSLALWNHNNGEDCWLGNAPEDEHWHLFVDLPSTKRVNHRRSLLKGVAVYRVLYQSILNAKLTGRKNLGRKRCTSNRDDCKLENTVKQSWFKHLGELHKEWTEAGISAPRVTTLRLLQEKGYQATSEPETTSEASYLGCGKKRTGLLLSGPKSSFQMKVNFAFHLEIKVPESGGRVERHRIHVAWSPVWSFHSQWWFGLPCHLLVLVHCVFWSPQSTQPSTRKF